MTDKGENLAGSVQTKQTEPTELNGGADGTLTADGVLPELGLATAAVGGATELDATTRDDPAVEGGGGGGLAEEEEETARVSSVFDLNRFESVSEVENSVSEKEDPTSVLPEQDFKDYRATALIDEGRFRWISSKGFKFNFNSEEISDEEFNSDTGSIGSWESEEEEKPDSVYFGNFDFAKAIGMKKKAEEGSSTCKERRLPVKGPVKPLYSFTIDMDKIPEKFKPNWPLDEKLWSSDEEDEENLEKKGGGSKKEGKRTHEPP